MNDPTQQAALYEGHVFGLLKDRTFIEVRGADRATFLHNLCTNDIKALAAEQGCEAFFTNVQGKTLCHALLFCDTEAIYISTDPGIASQLIPHLDKYLIREDVQLLDQSDVIQTFLFAGPKASEVMQQRFVHLNGPCRHTHLKDMPETRVAQVPFAGAESFFFFAPTEKQATMTQLFTDSGASQIDGELLEVARIEAEFPSSGRDLTSENLPQEIGRDDVAISFTKGCYLGQETVARIDALGHVNKQLVTLEFEGAKVPPAGTPLQLDEQHVGIVTTSCWSPKRRCPLALGFVRRQVVEQTPTLTSEFGKAKVIA